MQTYRELSAESDILDTYRLTTSLDTLVFPVGVRIGKAILATGSTKGT